MTTNQQTAIDLSAFDGPGAEPPTQSINNLGFMTFDQSGYDPNLYTGHIETHAAHHSGGFTSGTRKTGTNTAAGRFLDNRGFGWLLETVDDDDIYQKPLLEELDIDLTDIYYKVRCVLLPLPVFRMKLTLVRESPDFWGPLMVVVSFALLSLYGQLSVLSWILTFWFVGSWVIFFLARMLGGDFGYTQCLGIIGYCLIPLVLCALIRPLVASFRIITVCIQVFGVVWAVYSAGSLLCVEELQKKKSLIWYPVFLLYIYFLSLNTGV